MESDEPRETMSSQRRLFLWCLPRSGSTALTKCLSHLDHHRTEVWFEGFDFCRLLRAHLKKATGVDVPLNYTGNEALFESIVEKESMYNEPLKGTVDDQRLLSYQGVKEGMESSNENTVIAKDMVIASHGAFEYIPTGFKHVLIIRHPARVFPSFKKMMLDIYRVQESDIDFEVLYDPFNPPLRFYGEMHALWTHLKSMGDPNPLIIDTDDLLSNPAPYIRKICEVIGAEYRDDLLSWDSSMEKLKSWKSGWIRVYTSETAANSLVFQRAFYSSKFYPSSPMPCRDDLSQDLLRLIDNGMEFYEEMWKHRYVPSS